MVKAIKYTFRGMNRDFTESKNPLEFYYQANNIRFNTTDETVTGGFSFEKGNDLKVTIPQVVITSNLITYIVNEETKTLSFTNTEIATGTSGNHNIIGYAITRNSTLVFTTDDAGIDCLWEIDNESYDITLLYLNNLEFNTSNPIQTIFNFENENIQKVYWVDGKSQIRALNIKYEQIEGNGPLIDIPANSLDSVANVNFSQPIVDSISSGGNHTAGVIQYAYNLYRLNSSQTKASPLSQPVSLDNGAGQGGGEVNEIVTGVPIVKISNIDQNYTHIKIYAIKYTSYNQIPSIKIIEEREIGGQSEITVFDDGNSIGDISLDEFTFLGSNPIIPQHIESKDNILFPVNLKEKFFDVELDTRAYSFSSMQTSTQVFKNVAPPKTSNIGTNVNTAYENLPLKHPAINLYLDVRKYQFNSTVLGGSGRYITYEIVQKTAAQLDNDPEEYKFLKDDEVYRFGIEFYNKLGQRSQAKWIADYKMPAGNLAGNYNTLKVTLTAAFDTWLATDSNFATEDDRPVGYKILRAERDMSDRTIIDQGILSPMMFQVKGTAAQDRTDATWGSTAVKESYQDDRTKIPSWLTRTFDIFPPGGYNGNIKNGVLQKTDHLLWLSSNATANLYGGEVYVSLDDYTLSQTIMHTKMMQFYSPEILFDVHVNFPAGLNLRVKGGELNTNNGIYAQEINNTTKLEELGGKTYSGLNPHLMDSSEWVYDNGFNSLLRIDDDPDDNNFAFVGPNGNQDGITMDFHQYYREYSTFTANDQGQNILYSIYGAPEITERGAGETLYNKDPRYKYNNSLQSFISGGNPNNPNGIVSINSFGAKSAMVILADTPIAPTSQRPGIEDIKPSVVSNASILIAELVRDSDFIYFGGIYGGNSYEDKKRTIYLGIGDYKTLASSGNTVEIDNAGDTFVQEFKFLRISKSDTEVYDNTQLQMEEIVSFFTETTIDLKNRNDISLSNWDSQFQPSDDEYHKYNRVYSQEPSLVRSNSFDFTFKRIKNFDSRIIATKTKVPNETVDSWTDILDNTSKDLDGKYGPINSVVNFRDQIYTFQDNALALIGINPRVQTQGTDGIAIELGTGSTLYDYQYISTKSGCINKWGNLTTDSGIYYLDGLSKTFNRFDGKQIMPLSEIKGMHKYFINNLDVDNLRLDNPLKSTGVSFGYDQINHDVYLTYNNTWTICFNELLDAFTGFYSYNSPLYIYNKEKLLTININDSQSIYETHAGDYNMFYGSNEESKLIFLANPEPDHEITFNNLEYKSEAYNSNKVEQRYTWEAIRAYNEFQDSGQRTPEIRKLNRKYRLTIPRNANTTDRIRNTWSYIELTADNVNKYLYQNHDIILYYTPNYILIR